MFSVSLLYILSSLHTPASCKAITKTALLQSSVTWIRKKRMLIFSAEASAFLVIVKERQSGGGELEM